ncbi:MAG TPA: potassium channel protein [Lutibacter sp.]|nr:potassium channel protein [Lutibacter sp.]
MLKYINIKLYKALAIMLLVMLIGVLGYKYISDSYSWIDAIYMTVITTTTVGFGEVHPSGDTEKLFTIFLIITSISIYGYVVSVVSEFIANGRFFEQINKRKMQKRIQKHKNHTIVCGFGRNGKQAVERLISYDKKCIIIESSKKIIAEIEALGYTYVQGDATDDRALERANISEASFLITTMPSDADNLYVVLSARQMNKKMTIISRASIDTSYSKLKVAGANNIIMPDKIGGNHMASLIVTPDLVEFVERISIEGKEETNLEEIAVNNLPEEFINKTLLDLNLRHKTGCLVIGFKNAAHEYTINPDITTVLEPDSHLILLGNLEQMEKLHEVF